MGGRPRRRRKAEDGDEGFSMGRIVREIEVAGRTLKALFDTGSQGSYIRGDVAPASSRAVPPIRVGLGGSSGNWTQHAELRRPGR